MVFRIWLLGNLALAALGVATWGCSPNPEPQTGSQTNWLRACAADADCQSQTCYCGVCTHSCDVELACGDLPGASCVAADDSGAVALCGGSQPIAGALCLPRCGSVVCAEGQSCLAGVCVPISKPNAQVAIDLQTRFQQLVGLGSTLAYAENEVVQTPNQAELFDAMFSNLGLDILRLRDRYGYTGDDNLSTAARIIAGATTSLGRRPTTVLTSWSPPASLKANGATICRGDDDACTLARLSTGGFDYESYATYWRASLDAYLAVGVAPDYVSLQNNPEFVPSAAAPGEGCRFLPTQGTATVTTNGLANVLEFPGYAQAMAAVLAHFGDLAAPPKILAPDVSTAGLVADYLSNLDLARIDAVAHHLYGSSATSTDVSTFYQFGQVGQSAGRPLFQTEAQADGLGTALLLHHTLVTEGAAAYLHIALVGPPITSTFDSGALITIDNGEFTIQPAYHALRHYALYTDPGWVRVAAATNQDNLLASAWLSPSSDALTIVLVNAGLDPIAAEVGVGTATISSSRVTRTSFDGIERSADLGALPKERVLRLPGHSLATVTLAL